MPEGGTGHPHTMGCAGASGLQRQGKTESQPEGSPATLPTLPFQPEKPPGLEWLVVVVVCSVYDEPLGPLTCRVWVWVSVQL